MAAAEKRLTAHEIFEGVSKSARQELARSPHGLAFSGVAAGLGMGLTGLGTSAVLAAAGPGGWQRVAATALYPLGFIAVIIGRAQLFTENTLYPVVLVLDERRHVRKTLRLWAVVFAANIVGTLAFAALATRTGALEPALVHELVQLGRKAVAPDVVHVFWSGVVGGWLIALVAWLVSAGRDTIGQIVLIWLLAFVVGLGHFAHCIATSGEILSAVLHGPVGGLDYVRWLAAATAGNIAGGVVIVALLNYAQVSAGEE